MCHSIGNGMLGGKFHRERGGVSKLENVREKEERDKLVVSNISALIKANSLQLEINDSSNLKLKNMETSVRRLEISIKKLKVSFIVYSVSMALLLLLSKLL